MSVSKAISKLKAGESLTESQAEECATSIVCGNASESDMELILTALADKGETVDEIVGFVRAMRKDMIRVPVKGEILDVCGTGGTGHVRFNVSTAASFILAAIGIPVAKHGNRGSSSANGSFDFLEALGVRFDLSPFQSAQLLAEQNLCFLFARQYHLGVKHAANVRKKMGRRSIFNLVGPLSNPAGATHQVIGAPSLKLAEKLASAIQKLGCARAFVLVGAGGSDEVTIHDSTLLLIVSPNGIELSEIDPQTVGIDFKEAPHVGGTSVENAKAFMAFLEEPSIETPLGALISLNAAVAVWCFGFAKNLEAAYEMVESTILSGELRDKFFNYKAAASQFED